MITVLRKCLGIIPLFSIYLVFSASLFMLPFSDIKKSRYAINVASFFSRILLAIIGVRVQLKNRELLHIKKGCLIISNHVSYVDVLVLASLIPSIFITSIELKNTILLGTIAKCSRSIFIERRKATRLKRDIESVATALKSGFPVVLFPEGTTSNGDRVMEFKNSLFDAAVIATANILPICIRYTKIDDKPIAQQNRDDVFYYGGITFSEHVPRLLSKKTIDIEVIALSTIEVQSCSSRKLLSAIAHKVISTEYDK